jgi:hypothetical protein
MQTKAPRPWGRLLQVSHLFEQRERQLVVGRGGGACPGGLEACATVTLKGRNDRLHVRTRHRETASDTLFVPPFVPHPHDGPTGLIGVRTRSQGPQVELQLHGKGKAVEEVLDAVVMGLLAAFPLPKADDFAIVHRRRELFSIEDMCRNSLGIAMVLPPQIPKALIDEAAHARRGTTAGLRAHDGPLEARRPTAFGHRVRQPHKRPHPFVIMLHIVDTVELVLGKVLRSSPPNPPATRVSRRTTASPRASSQGASGLEWRNGEQKEGDRTLLYYKNREYGIWAMEKMSSMA